MKPCCKTWRTWPPREGKWCTIKSPEICGLESVWGTTPLRLVRPPGPRFAKWSVRHRQESPNYWPPSRLSQFLPSLSQSFSLFQCLYLYLFLYLYLSISLYFSLSLSTTTQLLWLFFLNLFFYFKKHLKDPLNVGF